jgi:hypothetical protein
MDCNPSKKAPGIEPTTFTSHIFEYNGFMKNMPIKIGKYFFGDTLLNGTNIPIPYG